jgi:hypothetical protein
VAESVTFVQPEIQALFVRKCWESQSSSSLTHADLPHVIGRHTTVE